MDLIFEFWKQIIGGLAGLVVLFLIKPIVKKIVFLGRWIQKQILLPFSTELKVEHLKSIFLDALEDLKKSIDRLGDRMSSVEKDTQYVRQELTFNGGSRTLKDQVSKMVKHVSFMERRYDIRRDVPGHGWEVDDKYRFRTADLSLYRWLDRQRKDFTGQSWINLIHPDQREQVEKTLDDGRRLDIRSAMQRSNGEWITCDIHARDVRGGLQGYDSHDEEGKVIGFLFSVRETS